MAEFFNVVFAGEIAGRADPAAVRANVGRIFNASEAVLDKLFSGQPVIIKKMLDRAAAMELRARMKLAGANTLMVQVDEQGRRVDPGAVATAAVATAPATTDGTMAQRVHRQAEAHAREEAARPKVNAPPSPADVGHTDTWAIYPVGSLLSAPLPRPAPLMPNIPDISLAATGVDIIAASERTVIAPVRVDISALSMAAAGSDVLRDDEREKVDAVVVDISGISIAPPGTLLDEIREEKALLNPDISHLKIV